MKKGKKGGSLSDSIYQQLELSLGEYVASLPSQQQLEVADALQRLAQTFREHGHHQQEVEQWSFAA